jgi:hypothetical protein
MPVVLSWLRLDLRRRWRSLVVLGLLIALSAGVVLAVNVMAAPPGQLAARMRIGHVLRAE